MHPNCLHIQKSTVDCLSELMTQKYLNLIIIHNNYKKLSINCQSDKIYNYFYNILLKSAPKRGIVCSLTI